MSGEWRTIESHTLSMLRSGSREDGGVDLCIGFPDGGGVTVTLCPTCTLQTATTLLQALAHASYVRAATDRDRENASAPPAHGGRAH